MCDALWLFIKGIMRGCDGFMRYVTFASLMRFYAWGSVHNTYTDLKSPGSVPPRVLGPAHHPDPHPEDSYFRSLTTETFPPKILMADEARPLKRTILSFGTAFDIPCVDIDRIVCVDRWLLRQQTGRCDS